MVSAPSVLPLALRRAVGGLPPVFWYLWAGTLINRIGSFVVPFLAIFLTDEVHLKEAEAGGIVALFGLGALLASPTGGYLADRFGRKLTLLAGLFTSAVAMLAFGFVREPTLIAVMAFLLGFTSELFRPAVSATVSDVVAPEHRLNAFTALYWAANLGFSIAPVLAGFMASRNFTALFVADALTTLVYAGLVIWKVPETKPMNARPPGAAIIQPPPAVQPQLWGYVRRTWERLGYSEVARDGVFLSFCLLCFLLAVMFFQHNSTLAFEMRRNHISTEGFGAILAVNGVLICVLQPFVANRLTKYRRSVVLAIASVLTGLGFGLNAWASTAALYVVGVAIWTLGEIAHSPVASSLVADLAPQHARGRYQAVFSMTFGMAFFVGPALGSYVMAAFGARTLWFSCIALGVAIALGHFMIAAPRRQRMESLRASGLAAATQGGE